jgi:hypothetical protein
MSLIKAFEVKCNVVERIIAACSSMLLMDSSPTLNYFNDLLLRFMEKCARQKEKEENLASNFLFHSRIRNSYILLSFLENIQNVSKRALQWYSKCYVAGVAKTFTLRGAQTSHCSRC